MKSFNFASVLDKVGSVGTLLAAASCPVCLPALAAVGGVLGLTALPLEGIAITYLVPLMVLLSVIGVGLSFVKHKKPLPLLTNILGSGAIFYALYGTWSSTLFYIGAVMLLVASGLNWYETKRCKSCKVVTSTKCKITCPKCQYVSEEEMPSNACLIRWTCPECKNECKPLKGDCCIFCSYGNTKCPPKQAE